MNDSFVVVAIELDTGNVHTHAKWEATAPGEDAVLYALAGKALADMIARAGTCNMSVSITLVEA